MLLLLHFYTQWLEELRKIKVNASSKATTKRNSVHTIYKSDCCILTKLEIKEQRENYRCIL